jgi:phosphoribosylanthranilate isomerase
VAARVEVKICGLTRPGDAAEAMRLGAARLGVVFAGGPRMIDAPRARMIVQAAGDAPVIGVFGAHGRDEILRIRDATGIRGAQLHLDSAPALEADLSREGLEVIRVVHLASSADLDRLGEAREFVAGVLVEPRVRGRIGGAGVALPLELARAARAALAGGRMILAGGLTPENVAAAVAEIAPEAVDVSSGVEQIAGIKNFRRMSQFMEALACR